mgnify:FL=1
MHKIDLKITHTLGSVVALERAKGLLERLKVQFSGQFTDLEEIWEGNKGDFTATIMGMAVSGALGVTEEHVLLKGDLPTDSSFMGALIEMTIRNQVESVLK